MFTLNVIGNLGGDAEFHNENGNKFITFRVGHTDRRTDSQGNTHEEVIWVSCILNGDGGNLLQYLKKGQKVFVSGDGQLRTYHSKKMQRLIAGSNLFVRSIELIGAKPDSVPSVLFTADGLQVNVGKYFFAGVQKDNTLFDRHGVAYDVTPDGWVIPPKDDNNATDGEQDDGSQGSNNTAGAVNAAADSEQDGGSQVSNSADDGGKDAPSDNSSDRNKRKKQNK